MVIFCKYLLQIRWLSQLVLNQLFQVVKNYFFISVNEDYLDKLFFNMASRDAQFGRLMNTNLRNLCVTRPSVVWWNLRRLKRKLGFVSTLFSPLSTLPDHGGSGYAKDCEKL